MLISPLNPAPRPDWSLCTKQVEPWVMPLSFQIASGNGPAGAVNELSFSPEGDLILYRKITPNDWDRVPTLMGIEEVWIQFKIKED